MESSCEENMISNTKLEELKRNFEKERGNLVLSKRPLATMQYFSLAMLRYSGQMILYIISHKFLLLGAFFLAFVWWKLNMVQGPHEQLMKDVSSYVSYAVWWVGLGIASSIGLGSGLHTFVLYLGPHIAMFTRMATLCGRVDLKFATYDTLVFWKGPTWELKACTDFGDPLFLRAVNSERYSVPLLHILQEVHWEAVLWGVGTALGELPPYFVSRAARLSGERLRKLEDLEPESSSDNMTGRTVSGFFSSLKLHTFLHFQKFNFWTILLFASVPNPLFDLAGMMCGQMLVPFWRFFIPTLIGKAIIKTHIQTVFVIILCNNHLIEQIEAYVSWLFERTPAVAGILNGFLRQLEKAKKSYNDNDNNGLPGIQKVTASPWKFSPAMVWNTFVWIMLITFFSSIINTTAQSYLLESHNKEIEERKKGVDKKTV